MGFLLYRDHQLLQFETSSLFAISWTSVTALDRHTFAENKALHRRYC